MSSEYPKPCCLCNQQITGVHDDHNPAPLKTGENDRCCSLCNQELVIEARIAHLVLYGIPWDFQHPRLTRYNEDGRVVDHMGVVQ